MTFETPAAADFTLHLGDCLDVLRTNTKIDP